jgi:hypothetical protein
MTKKLNRAADFLPGRRSNGKGRGSPAALSFIDFHGSVTIGSVTGSVTMRSVTVGSATGSVTIGSVTISTLCLSPTVIPVTFSAKSSRRTLPYMCFWLWLLAQYPYNL